MPLEPSTLTFDCGDPVRVATFWAVALGYELDADSDATGAYISDPSGRTAGMFFQPVPEPKTAKNRVHLDVRPTGSMGAEVERLKGLGATERGFIETEDSFGRRCATRRATSSACCAARMTAGRPVTSLRNDLEGRA